MFLKEKKSAEGIELKLKQGKKKRKSSSFFFYNRKRNRNRNRKIGGIEMKDDGNRNSGEEKKERKAGTVEV